MPGVPDLAGELVVVNGSMYWRTPGQAAFTQGDPTTLTWNPADKTSGPVAYVNTLLSAVADSSLTPKLLGTEQEPFGPCYHIQVQATPDVVKSKLSMTGEGLGSAVVDLWIYESDFRIERLEFHAGDPTAGAAAFRMVLSHYDDISPIEIPPASELATPEPTPSGT